MKAHRWQQLDQLFHSALQRDPGERAALLGKECAGNAELRQEVEALLAAHDEAGSFIEQPALHVEALSIANNHFELAAGQMIGHYRIVSQLGMGGMGEVYLADDTTLGRKVALKLLPNDFTRDRDRVRRFQQEARAASALNHPNIVTIHEIAHIDDRHFIATEFIDGETLRQWIAEGQSLDTAVGNGESGTQFPLAAVLNIAIQTADALSAAHEAGIVHRDIKPDNIMVRRRDGYVKVLDFGLAKLKEGEALVVDGETPATTHLKISDTSDGLVMGTVGYMSPEQAQGKKADGRTDVWSLGLVLYEMIAGRTPFQGTNVSDVMAVVLSDEELPPLTRYRRDVPLELERIVTRAVSKDREERYPTIKDLGLDLKRLKQHLEFEAELERNSTPGTRDLHGIASMVSKIKRHKFRAFVVLAALLATTVAVAYFTYSRYFTAGVKAGIQSIAVLPFANNSDDPNLEYLSDGIAETLINSLTQLRQLRVVARTTAFSYKDKEIDPQAIGRELGVQAILTGKLTQRGDKMVLQVELVETSNGSQVWGQQYDTKMSELLAVRQELAREITEKLRLTLRSDDEKRLTRGDAANPEAYELYLNGRYFWNKRTGANLKKAIEQFEQAIIKDPHYALAYIGLADSYSMLELYAGTPSSETLPKARAAAERALLIDGSLADAHASLGLVEQYSWNFDAAEREFKRAIELDPNSPTAHIYYGYYLHMVRGRFDEAMAEMRRAKQFDPLSPYIRINLATIHLGKGELEAAIEETKKIIELDPNFFGAHAELSLVYRRQGRYQEAIAELENSIKPGGAPASLGVCYAVAGNKAKAKEILKKVEEQYNRHEALGQHIAGIYAALGDKEQAFAWLEKDFQAHSGSLAFIAYDAGRYSLRDALSSDPRWNDLLHRIGQQQE